MNQPSPRARTIPLPSPVPGVPRGGLRGVRLGVLLSLGLVLAACGVSGEARRGARVLAAYTNQVKARTERYAKARTALAQARQRNVDELAQSAVATEQANQREIFLWAFEKPAPGPTRQELYQSVMTATDAARKQLDDLAALRKQHEARVAEATTHANARTAELAEAAKALAQLDEKPSFKQRMRFYLCFFESVHRSIEEAQQAGAAQTQLGTAAAQAKQAGGDAQSAPGGDAKTAPPAAPPDTAASRSACPPAS